VGTVKRLSHRRQSAAKIPNFVKKWDKVQRLSGSRPGE
jgi:hypothetical protein